MEQQTQLISIKGPEKAKLIKQQLILLLHANKCRSQDRKAGQQSPCLLPHCQTMKDVISHMITCNAKQSCTFPHCNSSRQIISHWKYCVNSACSVCLPVKDSKGNQSVIANQFNSLEADNEAMQAQNLPQVAEVLDDLSLVEPIPVQEMKEWQQSITPELRQHVIYKLLDVFYVNLDPSATLDNRMFNLLVAYARKVEGGAYEMANSKTEYDHLLAEKIKKIGKELQEKRKQKQQMQAQNVPLPGGSTPSQVQATPVQGKKEWHQSISPVLRDHLIHKLVQVIFPTTDPSAMLDKRMSNLVSYARKVEGGVYEKANSRAEYYHWLAVKIYKIEKEMKEKRRKKQQMQAQNMPQVAVLPSEPSQVQAMPVQGAKEWHQSITHDLRNHIVLKFLQAIFPTPDPSAELDKRMFSLVAFVRKVEGEYYEIANSRSEYYQLVAERMYKIQKALEEKRNERKRKKANKNNQLIEEASVAETKEWLRAKI